MLLIKTFVATSDISGLGLFADEDIMRGTVVWRFEPKLDTLLRPEELNILSSGAQKQFLNYAFFDKSREMYMLCGDDARFFNHSKNPNCDDSGMDFTIALRDIKKGEELTVDYNAFDGNIARHEFL